MGKVGRFLLGGVIIGASFIPGVGTALAAAMLSAGVSLSSSALFEALAGTPQRQGGVELNNADNQSPLPLAYGKVKLGLRLADMRAAGGENNKYLYIVGALCHGSSDGNGIAGIDEIYFDEELAIDAAGTVQGRFAGKLAFAKYLGTDSQTVDPTMTAAFSTAWTVNDPGKGVAYLFLRLESDVEAFPSGIPNVTCLCRGVKVLDIRAPGPFVYSTNPALAIYDYLTSTRYGIGRPTAALDSPSFITHANYYDELIPKGTGNPAGKRFEINGWLDVGQSEPDNLRLMATTCRGQIIREGSVYRIFTRRVVVPTVFTLNESNIAGRVRIRTPGVADCANRIRYTFVEPGSVAEPTYAVETRYWPRPEAVNTYLAADNNFEVIVDAELPLTTDQYTAEQIALVALKEQRAGIVLEVTAFESALQLQVCDLVPVSLDTPGWNGMLFWVMAMFLLPDAQVRFVLQQYDANAYELDALAQFPAPIATSLPNPHTVEAPTALVLTAGTAEARVDTDGSLHPYIRAAWTASTHPYVDRYDVQYRATDTIPWFPVPDVNRTDTLAEIPATEGRSYDVQVRAVNRLGKASVWVGASITPAIDVFRNGSYLVESFTGNVAKRWRKVAGNGTFGAKVDPDVKLGGTLGRAKGPVMLEWSRPIPFDPTLKHFIKVRLRQNRDPSSGSKDFFLGIAALRELPGQPGVYRYINTLGQDLPENHHYILANRGVLPAGREWTELTAWFQGHAGGKVALTPAMLTATGLDDYDGEALVNGSTDPANVGFRVDTATLASSLVINAGVPISLAAARFHMAGEGSALEGVWEYSDTGLDGSWALAVEVPDDA